MGTFVLISETAFEFIISAKLPCSTSLLLRPGSWTFFPPRNCSPHTYSRYWAVDYMWIGLYPRLRLCKVICRDCHTFRISAIGCIVKAIFFSVVWQISAVWLFHLQREDEKRYVCAHLLPRYDSHSKIKMLAALFITAFHINILLKATSTVCFIFFISSGFVA